MKKIFLILTSLLFGLNILAQQNESALDGIWGLRFGMSQKQVREMVDISLIEETEFPDVVGENILKKLDLKKYLLKSYKIFDEYILEDIKLLFFKDKLYRIEIRKYNPITEYLITKKYGEPEEVEIKTEERIKYKNWFDSDSEKVCIAMYKMKSNDEVVQYMLYMHDNEIMAEVTKALDNYLEMLDIVKKLQK